MEGALAQQRVPVSEAPPTTSSNCWTRRGTTHGRAAALLDSRPLALRLAAAMDDRCPAPGRALRDVADAALLLGGLFRRRAPPEACRQRTTTGSAALRTARWARNLRCSHRSSRTWRALCPVRRRLLAKLASGPRCRRHSGLVRALESWQRSRDRVTERLLAERGVVLALASTATAVIVDNGSDARWTRDRSFSRRTVSPLAASNSMYCR